MKKKISRQRKWQIKKANEGKCKICGKKAVVKLYCQKHRVAKNKRQRERRKECQFVFGFNKLGMIMFHCKTHGDIESVYNRLEAECRSKIIKKIEKFFK